jgi:hypothetical protein
LIFNTEGGTIRQFLQYPFIIKDIEDSGGEGNMGVVVN